MELKTFIKNVANQFDDIDTSAFNEKTKFKDNPEWSSLTILSIIAMADSHYSVKIKGTELQQISTIEELYNFIQSKK